MFFASNIDLLQHAQQGQNFLLAKQWLTPYKHSLSTEEFVISYDGFFYDTAENPFEDIWDKYKLHGEFFYEVLDGIFALVLIDKTNDKIFFCNNRYTCHNFYYYKDSDNFLVSNSLREISLNLSPDINWGSVRSFFSNGFTIPDQTAFSGIKKLLPTFAIVYEKDDYKLINHWENEIEFQRAPFENLESHIDQYENIYQNGIKKFVKNTNTKELGTFLSGGHDTSFCLIHSSKVFDKPIKTFTTTFPNWGFDEGGLAENLSKKFGAEHFKVPFTTNELDLIVDLIYHTEEPVVGSSLPLHQISILASNHVDSLLGGDGGDTLWGEYYPVAEYQKYIQHLPTPMRKLFHQMAKVLRDTTDWERFWELEHVSKLFTEKDYCHDFMRRLCTYRHFSDETQEELFNNEYYAINPLQSIKEINFTPSNFKEALIEGKLFNAFYTYQSFHTYKSVNGLGMNLLFPTIKKDVINFICNLPYEWVNGGNTFQRLTNNKKINRKFHKQALSRHLETKEIYNRSFDIPWYLILKPRIELLKILKQCLLSRPYYNKLFIEKLFFEFENQKVKNHELLELKHHGYRIFTLLSFEVWCQLFIDRKSYSPTDRENLKLEEFLTN